MKAPAYNLGNYHASTVSDKFLTKKPNNVPGCDEEPTTSHAVRVVVNETSKHFGYQLFVVDLRSRP